MTIRAIAVGACVVLLAVGCGSDGDESDSDTATTGVGDASTTVSSGPSGSLPPDDGEPHVVAVVATADSNGTYSFDVTISSPYDGPDKYADAWRVLGEDGEVYGVRELTHDHASEQPFTRSLSGVELPDGTTVVWVEARDLLDGWSGELFEVQLPEG